MKALFRTRRDAGKRLAAALSDRHYARPYVLALPRGGIPVAYEVAQVLNAPLDVCVVRKLGLPNQPEFAMGAIARDVTILDNDLIRALALSQETIDAVIAEEAAELARREELYRGDRSGPTLEGRDAIIVDDGLATGATMRAAIAATRQKNPARVIVAAPVGAQETCELLEQEADEVVCLETPTPFQAVGMWYASFPQTQDDEVLQLLELARPREHP